jgi:hypothetical protein
MSWDYKIEPNAGEEAGQRACDYVDELTDKEVFEELLRRSRPKGNVFMLELREKLTEIKYNELLDDDCYFNEDE